MLFKSKDFNFDYSISSTNLEIFLLSEWAQSCIWNDKSGFNQIFSSVLSKYIFM